MKEKKKIMNNFPSKAKSLTFDHYSKFLIYSLKILDDQHRSKQNHMIKNAISNYETKTFFLLKKIKQYSLEVSTDDRNFTVKDFIKNVEGALMTVMQSPHCYNLLLEIKKFTYKEWKEWNEEIIPHIGNFLEELKISDLSVLAGCFDYLDKIYKKDKLFQPNLFIKVVAITRLFYAYLIWNQLLKLREKIEKDSNDSSIWIDAYKIGVLQGNLGLIEAFLDPAIKDIQHREKSGEPSRRHWDEERKTKEQEEKPAIEDIEKTYKELQQRQKGTMPHNKAADIIEDLLAKKYPQIHHFRELVLRTIRPKAKESGLLRGIPRPEFPGRVVEVDAKARHLIVKNNVEEKTFFISKGASGFITKGDKRIQLANLKKGMNVSVKYRIEKQRLVARAINVIPISKATSKKHKEKPVEDPKK
jgi:DNA integrity scanning protein DisA with diadenylate cyclase activity